MIQPIDFSDYTNLLIQELKVATGCTEPIAIAYGAALATQLLGKLPQHYEIACSSNVIKNVKAVTVPNTGGLKGIEAAVIAGAVGGNPDSGLNVISKITDQQRAIIKQELKKNRVVVQTLDSCHSLHIIVNVFDDSHCASVEIIDKHDGIRKITLDGKLLQGHHPTAKDTVPTTRQTHLTIENIIKYADSVDISDVAATLEQQIQFNEAIALEGLRGNWGVSVGRTLLEKSDDLRTRIKAIAAAGSDARMNGCALPVVINNGSGNQGITASLPVLVYARAQAIPHEKLLRALCVSNLIALHQKSKIGRLSAYCGAVSAAAIAYLDGCDVKTIEATVINGLGNISGMICDGAKSSCAAKIASSIESAMLGYDIACKGQRFKNGEGLVKSSVELTIDSIGRLARIGMKSTDNEILHIMLEQ